jgi:hypothetical protein
MPDSRGRRFLAGALVPLSRMRSWRCRPRSLSIAPMRSLPTRAWVATRRALVESPRTPACQASHTIRRAMPLTLPSRRVHHGCLLSCDSPQAPGAWDVAFDLQTVRGPTVGISLCILTQA